LRQHYLSATPQLLVGSFVILLWTGWGLMSTFIEGVNRAYGLHEKAPCWDQIAPAQLKLSSSPASIICFGV
jgi:uncharacterized BrkB/YihY/UPF0761 family membrane protein